MFLRAGHSFRSRWVDPPQYRHLACGADGGCDLAILICVCVCTEAAGDESSLALIDAILHFCINLWPPDWEDTGALPATWSSTPHLGYPT